MACGTDWISVTPPERRTKQTARRGYRVAGRTLTGEAAIGRYKRVIGDALRSRTDETEASEVAIAARVLNPMLRFGRPNYVRTV
jgi:hypothetical protein